jgi:alkaline phosphatase
VVFIADGAGTGYWTAAHFAADALAVHRFPVVGLVDVRSASSDITDSAASATSYACGVVTYNGAIGVDPDSVAVSTVLEMAAARGMATGLVATSSITHATPAAFAAHVPSRAMQQEIARQMVERRPTVVLGGGRKYFDPAARRDSLDLLRTIRDHYTYVQDAGELGALRTDTVSALFGLFAHEHMPSAADRTPTLQQMTEAALSIMGPDPDGFFLMVEASQPDWRGHDNAPLEAVTAEMLDLDRAVASALRFRERFPETLVVITADHETGGLALQHDESGSISAAYTSGGHTATMVPLFAIGPGAERFGGIATNDQVGRLLIELVRR